MIISTIAQEKDITERKHLENEWRWNEQYNSILSYAAAALLTARNPRAIINKLSKRTMKFLKCQVFLNFMAVPEDKRFYLNSYAGIPKKEAKRIEWLDYDGALCGYAASRPKRYIAENIFEKKNPHTNLIRNYGVRAYCCYPLQIGKEILGTLSFGTKNRDTFNPDEILLMKSLTGLIAVAIQRKKAEDAIKKVNKELEVRVRERTRDLARTNVRLNNELAERIKTEKFIRITNALLKLADRCHDKKEYIKIALRLMKSWVRCECAGIRIVDEEKRIPYEAHTGYSHSFMESENLLSLESDSCACTRVITGKYLSWDKKIITESGSFFINDTDKFLKTLPKKGKSHYRGVCMAEGFKSIAVVPIRYKNIPIAAIHLADKRKNIFPSDKVDSLEKVMPFIGDGIQKFSLTEKVERSSELLEKIFSNTNFMIAYLDRDFNFIRVNNAYAAADNKTPEFFVGKNMFALYPNDKNREIFERVVERGIFDSMFAQPFLYERNYEHGLTYCDWSLQPVKDNSGKVEGVILCLVDITKRKQAEGELLKTQRELSAAKRLSDIGTLAATVAHELRNPLAAMRMAAYNIKVKSANDDLEKHLANIEKKITESDQIINNLLFYSRLKVSSYQKINIKDILEECVEHIRPQSEKNNIEIRASIIDTPMEADPLQLNELFDNILNNAYDAIITKKGLGRIEISTDILNGNFLEVHISDNGAGMNKESLKRLYEPFYTTKAKGTGLGLTVCYQIVNLHKGAIDITSEENKTTTVTVKLPLTQGANLS